MQEKKFMGKQKVSVFIGRNIQTGEPVAIKLARLLYEKEELLMHEAKLLTFLKEIERILNIYISEHKGLIQY